MKYFKSLFIRIVLCFVPVKFFLFIFTALTVYGSYLLLLPFFNILVKDSFLIVNGFPFEIIEACVASLAYYLLWVLCLLTKDINIKIRAKIILYGFLLIFGMNIFRIFLLVMIAFKYGFYWFSVVHLAFWNFVSGVYVALVWIFLVRHYKIHSIPIYDDIKTIYRMGFSKKKSRQ